MRLRGARLLLISGLVLAASTTVFSRVSDSLNLSGAQPQLAALASFYKSSDPTLPATFLRGERELAAPAGATRGTDFSTYVHLHVTRADDLAQRDGID